MRKIYKIKPSLLSTYGTKCEHCLWMSVRAGWGQKSLNLTMNTNLSNHAEGNLDGKRTEQYVPELGKGRIIDTGGLVCSHKLPLKGDADFYIAGEYDHLVKLEDGTYAVIDDKTTALGEDNFNAEHQLETYANQVLGYAYSLENPGSESWLNKIETSSRDIHPNRGGKVPEFGPRDPNCTKKTNPNRYSDEKIEVSRLGLNNFRFPEADLNDDGTLTVKSVRMWAEVPKDYKSLLEHCQNLADIVLQDSPPPPPNEGRKFRKYIDCTFCWDYIRHSEHR